jgi:ATP adenylyltransferase
MRGEYMKRMWSPWRSKYIETFKRPPRKRKRGESLFTEALKSKSDDRHFIVWRGKLSFVIMNLYPYNSGHLMIVPCRMVSKFEDLQDDELLDLMQTTRKTMRALQRVVRPQGFNFGANFGRAAGAGVDDHVHFHVVPRWNGDTNFMPVLSDTKVVSEDMKTTLRKLRKAFATTD